MSDAVPTVDTDVLIVGGGAAGLMAADAALRAGVRVLLAEAKPSLARKVLMAGKSGLNLTKDEALEDFLAHYEGGDIARFVRDFDPDAVRAWADGYGAACFTGSSGKLFPKAMKASPLLRAWISDLQARGLAVQTRWRWVGASPEDWVFETPDGARYVDARAVVFALGGASWPKLGSDGAWVSRFPSTALRPANMGFDVAWSDYMSPYFGHWLKNVVVSVGHTQVKGEVGLTRYGVEGGAIYALGEAISAAGYFDVDLLPKMELSRVEALSSRASLTNRLRKLKISEAGRALFFECSSDRDMRDVKALRVFVTGARPIAEAISTAGGVRLDALNTDLSLKAAPHVFVAGEMLDWSAPTGGYLLTGAFATGRAAGKAAGKAAACFVKEQK